MSANQWRPLLPHPSFLVCSQVIATFTGFCQTEILSVSPPFQESKTQCILLETSSPTAVCKPVLLCQAWHFPPSASHFHLTVSKILQTHLFPLLCAPGKDFPAPSLAQVSADPALTHSAPALLMVAAGLFLSAAHPRLYLQLLGLLSCTNPHWRAVEGERSNSFTYRACSSTSGVLQQ